MEMQRSSGTAEVELPGFRFHPTEEELLDFYLRRAVNGKKLHFDVIATVHLYRYDPWDLPSNSSFSRSKSISSCSNRCSLTT